MHCSYLHQEDKSLCAFVLWSAHVCGVLRGELLHCKKWEESPTSGFEIRILLMVTGGELDFFFLPLLLEPSLALNPAKILRGVWGFRRFPFSKQVPYFLSKGCDMKCA